MNEFPSLMDISDGWVFKFYTDNPLSEVIIHHCWGPYGVHIGSQKCLKIFYQTNYFITAFGLFIKHMACLLSWMSNSQRSVETEGIKELSMSLVRFPRVQLMVLLRLGPS